MNTDPGTKTRSGRKAWVAFIAVVVAVAAFAIWKSASVSRSMAAAAASDERQFSESTPGSKTKFVMEIGEVTVEKIIRGKLLQKKTEELYTRTTTPVRVQSSEKASVVMGTLADVKAGAIVHIAGTVQNDHSVQAEQIVILTGYVKVQ